MATFEEYQAIATRVPVSLRNDGRRIQLSISGMQEEAGKVGELLTGAMRDGKFRPNELERETVKEKLSELQWYLATLCHESNVGLEEFANHSLSSCRKD